MMHDMTELYLEPESHNVGRGIGNSIGALPFDGGGGYPFLSVPSWDSRWMLAIRVLSETETVSGDTKDIVRAQTQLMSFKGHSWDLLRIMQSQSDLSDASSSFRLGFDCSYCTVLLSIMGCFPASKGMGRLDPVRTKGWKRSFRISNCIRGDSSEVCHLYSYGNCSTWRINTLAERQTENKRKFEDAPRNNQNQQPNKRQNTGRAYAAGNGDRNRPSGTRPPVVELRYQGHGSRSKPGLCKLCGSSRAENQTTQLSTAKFNFSWRRRSRNKCGTRSKLHLDAQGPEVSATGCHMFLALIIRQGYGDCRDEGKIQKYRS
ncbi:hypothetical protein Tco_0169877 [Tanacetum coccineum]